MELPSKHDSITELNSPTGVHYPFLVNFQAEMNKEKIVQDIWQPKIYLKLQLHKQMDDMYCKVYECFSAYRISGVNLCIILEQWIL